MDALKKARAPYRRSVTRLSNDIKALSAAAPLNLQALKVKLEILQEAYTKVAEIDKQIIFKMIQEDEDDDDVGKERKDQEDYSANVKESKIIVNGLTGTNPSSTSTGSASLASRSFKLPEIKLRSFNGDLISLAQSGFEPMSCGYSSKPDKKISKQKVKPTLAGFHNGELSRCAFCGKRHKSKDCFAARKMTVEDKRAKLQDNNCCLACFAPGHTAKKCRAFLKCYLCNMKHQTLICPKLEEKPSSRQHCKSEVPVEKKDPPVTADMSNLVCSSEVVLGTLMVTLHGNGKTKNVRAFIDPGSHGSYIRESTAEDLKLVPVAEEEVIHSLFGGGTVADTHKNYCIKLQHQSGRFTVEFKARDQKEICNPIPRVSPTTPGLLQQLKEKKIWISDMGMDIPPIEIMIGGDVWAKLLTGKMVHLPNGLTAVETHLGWTLWGEPKDSTANPSVGMATLSMTVSDVSVTDLCSLEAIGIHDPVESKKQAEQDEEAKTQLLETISRREDGRYIIGLPWRQGHPAIPSNRGVAMKRLESATKRYLSEESDFKNYDKIFEDWEKEGFIERVPTLTNEKSINYIPHRPVFKPESLSTPVRPVFDCSCRVGKQVSLNDCLYTGPNYVQLIPELLLRFRDRKIGVSSDIRNTFQMIEIREADRNFLRFLWWEDDKLTNLIEYRHKRVVFGATCSPFILGAVIEYHLLHVGDEDNQAAEELLLSLYIDNSICSVDTVEEYGQFKSSSVDRMEKAKMELRQWMTNLDQVADGQEDVSVLGVLWNRRSDALSADLRRLKPVDQVTKRVILSPVQRIFDPIGFLAPATITAKILLQLLWVQKLKWDDALPDDVVFKFQRWYAEIQDLSKIYLPRMATGGEQERDKWPLHTFTDASCASYACVCFLRVDHRSSVTVQLLAAKARVAPLKRITIPRLELLGCLIGARMAAAVKKALSLHNVGIYFWSDSATAIAWIQRNEPWATFVGNRFAEINKLADSSLWYLVPGSCNPADFPSRGCSPSELLESKWWEGSQWLKLPSCSWPTSLGITNEEEVLQERKKSGELFQGWDVVRRVAGVKVQDGELTRPIQRLYPLEIGEPDKDSSVAIKTKYGRMSKKPDRYK